MSLPRDLKVEIPGHGTDKLNVAYTLGGPKLSIKTVKQLTGLAINHYVDVSFHGFAEGVNALGCVYVDIDRRYFNNNAGLGYGAELRGDRREARLPEDVRAEGARVRALPAHRQRHRARRPPAGLPAAGARAGERVAAARQDRQADRHLRRQHALRHPVHRRPAPAAAPDAGRDRQADQAGQVPRPAGRVLRDREPRPDQGRDAPVPVPASREGPAQQEPQALQDGAQGQGRHREPDRRDGGEPAAGASSRSRGSASPSTTRGSWSEAPRSPRTARAPTRSAPPTTSATAPTRW